MAPSHIAPEVVPLNESALQGKRKKSQATPVLHQSQENPSCSGLAGQGARHKAMSMGLSLYEVNGRDGVDEEDVGIYVPLSCRHHHK